MGQISDRTVASAREAYAHQVSKLDVDTDVVNSAMTLSSINKSTEERAICIEKSSVLSSPIQDRTALLTQSSSLAKHSSHSQVWNNEAHGHVRSNLEATILTCIAPLKVHSSLVSRNVFRMSPSMYLHSTNWDRSAHNSKGVSCIYTHAAHKSAHNSKGVMHLHPCCTQICTQL